MQEDPELSPLLPHGGYRRLRSYKVAQAVYDATVVFCRRFYANDRRMAEQMIQAARSGLRNISEASGAAATSRKAELKLTNVARASLADELLPDYESFLRQNGLRVWPKESREARAMRARLTSDESPSAGNLAAPKVRLEGLFGLAGFVARAEPEIAGNAMVCAVNQAAYLLKRQLESQARAFAEEGGFTENLYHVRQQARSRHVRRSGSVSEPSDKSDVSDLSDVPSKDAPPRCPKCGNSMVQRVARHGFRPGSPFWGCSSYPDCRATLPLQSN